MAPNRGPRCKAERHGGHGLAGVAQGMAASDFAASGRGDDGFDAALAEMVERGRGKPGGITDQHEVFRISVIKGLKGLKGHGEDLTIIRTVVDPKPESSPRQARACLRTGIDGQRGSTGEIADIVRPAQTAAAICGIGQ
jgi:hypothetical protein